MALELAGLDRNGFNYLLRGDVLRTNFDQPEPGESRKFTRENTLELAFVAAQMRVGISATEAAINADTWMRLEASGKLNKLFVKNAGASDGEYADETDTVLDLMLPHQQAAGGWSAAPATHQRMKLPTELVLINLEEIVQQVDELFDSMGDGDS